MKLTKSKLKQIIKEELRSVLYETWPEAEASREEELEPTSTYQPYPPGPVEKRIRGLEDMVWGLFSKLTGPPMTDEERAAYAEKMQGELTPVREGRDCAKVHPKMSHKKWKKQQ